MVDGYTSTDDVLEDDWERWRGMLVHRSSKCAGQTCTIHNPSDHHMKNWPQFFRMDRGIMERVCIHNVGHPDPDDMTDERTHGCCGCCEPGRFETYER